MAALQTAAFLLSVCHVLLVVTDQAADLSLLHVLETADMLRPTAPSTGAMNASASSANNDDDSATGNLTGEHVARLELVLNKAQRAAMNSPAQHRLSSLLGTLLKQPSSTANRASTAAGVGSGGGRSFNLTVLPRVRQDSLDAGWSRLEWVQRTKQLRRRLLASSRSSLAGALALTVTSGQQMSQSGTAFGGAPVSATSLGSAAQAAAFSEKRW